MSSNNFYPRPAKQASATDLVQIAAHYETSTAFAEEVSIDQPTEEYNPTKLHVSTQEQTDHIHKAEKEALAHWAQ
jgi:hypothetical protein